MNPDAKQVVTIAPDGVISSLRRKDGLDLRQFGNVEIQRISDIKWSTTFQKWYIEIINGPKKGVKLHRNEWEQAGFCELPHNSHFSLRLLPRNGPLILFKEYEEAVEAEIIFLDDLRRKGVF